MRAKLNKEIVLKSATPVKLSSGLMPGSKKYFSYSIHVRSFAVSKSVSYQNCHHHSLKNH